MRLTQRTDYGLRLLMYLAINGEVASVRDIAARFRLSPHHVMKVAQELGKAGWVEAQRGRGGGLTLAVEPRTLKIGDVVRRLEPDFRLVECFEPAANDCIVTKACRLRGVLEQALELFLGRLNAVTLADLMEDRRALAKLLQIKTTA
ncbi:MAG: Rrf2 family transcriptional regulator [Bryobacterales bacterium]